MIHNIQGFTSDEKDCRRFWNQVSKLTKKEMKNIDWSRQLEMTFGKDLVLDDDDIVEVPPQICQFVPEKDRYGQQQSKDCQKFYSMCILLDKIEENQDLLDKYKENKQIILAAVKRQPWLFKYIHESLQCDKEVVLATLNSIDHNDHPSERMYTIIDILKLTSDALRKDKEVALTAIEIHPNAFHFIAKELKLERDLVLKAVNSKRGTFTLNNLDESFVKDREIVLAAVQKKGSNLGYAPAFKKDKEIVRAAVKNEPSAIRFSDLKDDRDIVLAAVERRGDLLRLTPKFQNDREVVLAAIRNNGVALQFSSFMDDKQMVLIALQTIENALEEPMGVKMFVKFLSESIKNNKDVADAIKRLLKKE